MKKLFITFLCVVMVLVFMPVMAFATGGIDTQDELTQAIEAAEDGALIDVTGTGVYLAGTGKTTIEDATITGATGIEIRAGKLDVTGNAAITATVEEYVSTQNSGGPVSSGGGAIVVAQHTTKQDIEVNINGGAIVVAGGVFQDLEKGENVTISDTVDAAVTVETSLDMMKHLEIFGQENIQLGFDLFKEYTPEQIKAANIRYNITKAKEGVKFDVPD